MVLAASLGLGLAVASDAGASSIVRMDLEALSAGADSIFVGTVEKTDAHFVSPSGRYIVTDVTLVAETFLAGPATSSRFVIRALGGEVGTLGQRVFGEASYQANDRVMVFAVQRQGVSYTLGMAQGAMHIENDEHGVARIKNPQMDANLIGPASPVSTEGRRLDDVVDQVRSLVAGRARR
ncbi:MAG: hypothetical protein M3O50_16495 [Myxococcota bacterium]|nr:hypothetical protein [Myxococcota bacterium]